MERFIYFRDGEDDAYMNTSDNFRGMRQGASATVEMYFESPISSRGSSEAYDKITLTVTDAKEKEAMVAIGGALAGAKAGSTCIVADDFASVYADDNITGVAISLATMAKLMRVETFTPAGDGTAASGDTTNSKILTAADSGTTYMCNIATNTAAFRLPAVAGNAGVFYNFVLDVNSDAEATKDLIISTNANGENIIGAAISGGAAMDVTVGTSQLIIDSSDCGGDSSGVSSGDRVGLFCDGTNWYLQDTVANPTASFDIADAAV